MTSSSPRPGNGQHYAKLDDIERLVIASGADCEYTTLLTAAGFGVRQITDCGERFSLVQAQPSA